MKIGIFTRIFVRPTLEETLDAIKGRGLECVQFNMESVGLPTLPSRVDDELCGRIRRQMDLRNLTMSAVSGTFNLIDLDLKKRRDGLNRLRVMAAACRQLGTSVITLCTGTRDPENMWRHHPENDTAEAWKDLVESVSKALKIAEENHVILAFEPEVSNVVDSAKKARQLMDEMGSPNLKVVMDGANIFHAGELSRMREILNEAFELIGKDIVMAHAKDLSQDGEAGHEAAGHGVLDYDRYISLLKKFGFDGALTLHSLAESQVEGCVSFLQGKL